MSPDASTLMILAVSIAGGVAAFARGSQMELASVRAARAAEPTPAEDEQEADDAVQAADL
jgi:hypothetical protein